MRKLSLFLVVLVLIWGGAQVAFSGIKPAEFRNNKAGILSLRNTESFDFRVQAIELDGVVLDTAAELLAQRSLVGLGRIGGSHDLPPTRNCPFRLEHHHQYGPR